MTLQKIKIWSVTICGEGFLRQNSNMGFELSGYIKATDPNEALLKAIKLAKQEYFEISQLEKEVNPKPVINAEEIQEFADAPQDEVDKIEIYWHVE
jgi:hypothetical protein